ADPVIKGASEARSRAENAVLNLCTRYAPTAHPVFEAGFSSANLSTSESQIRTALRDLPAQAHDEPLYKQVGIAMEELVQGRSQLAYLERQIQIAVSEITSAQERLNKADKDLTGTKPFDDQSFRQLVDDLYEYQQFFLGVPFFFVKFPGIMLTLLLTVFMGILGSLIALTRELVFDDEEYTVGTYLFRIALGAGVALAVFFFAGAGVLTLAQTTNGDASHVELGPYLVSFFGIVSGYLSKRVTLWMREVGGNVFRLKGEPDRWGFNLPVALSASGESAETMARAIGATNEQVKFWLDGVKAAPQDIQERIAAFLRKPKHELFTDVAP
ncbi:MAG TPA: hypothetical protein VN807_07195, partial [Candidatus Sulfotelmatobacter sp.]|nr:hypothetical protein [Candidatus Sulfotelmatobacter sp.]